MNRKETNYLLIAFLFITCLITSNFVASREVIILGLNVSASVFIYPLTYVIAIVFRNLYGNDKVKTLFNLSICASVFCAFLISIAATYPITHYDGLNPLFNRSFAITVASIIAFYISQNLNIIIYNNEKRNKSVKFLISGVIAVTVDGFIFVILNNITTASIIEMFNLFKGHYVLNGLGIICYFIIMWAIETLEISWKRYNKEKKKNNEPVEKQKRKTKKVQK